MKTNALPKYDMSENPTQCCPRFNPENWDGQELHFKDKLFVKAHTKSLFHIPLNMASMYRKTISAIQHADAMNDDDFIVLSRDPSPFSGEHLFAVNKDVPDQELVRLSGDFVTKVFEGPFRNAPKWERELLQYVEDKGKTPKKTYYFYTTCPKCAKYYGKNYVVGICELAA